MLCRARSSLPLSAAPEGCGGGGSKSSEILLTSHRDYKILYFILPNCALHRPAIRRQRHDAAIEARAARSLVRLPPPVQLGRRSLIVFCRDYCASDITDDAVRQQAKAVLCPAEMDNDEEVGVELS